LRGLCPALLTLVTLHAQPCDSLRGAHTALHGTLHACLYFDALPNSALRLIARVTLQAELNGAQLQPKLRRRLEAYLQPARSPRMSQHCLHDELSSSEEQRPTAYGSLELGRSAAPWPRAGFRVCVPRCSGAITPHGHAPYRHSKCSIRGVKLSPAAADRVMKRCGSVMSHATVAGCN